MDYELKYVIAICLIVKIAALSPEFSIREETERSEQSPGPKVEASFSPSPETQATSADRPKEGRLFDWGPGRRKFNEMKARHIENVKSEKIKENQSFDTCEYKLELLESSLNWRDIRKTLHWLNRILASNQTNMQLCHRRKDLKRQSSFHAKIKKNDLHTSRLKKKNFLKKSANQDFNWGRRNYKTRTHSRRPNKKLNNERKHKQRSWKNRLREEKNKKEKVENKRKKSRFDKYFENKEPMKFSQNNAPILNATFLKPNSVLFDAERIFFPRTKSKNDFKSHPFTISLLKNVKNCEDLKWTQKKSKGPEWGSAEMKSKEQDQENGSGTKAPKQKPWPHFVYHRVSSNFLHPDGTNQNHKQSAYLAISVVTSSKPDSTDNNQDI